MTTGIYALYWEEQDLIYIGLSQRIEGRFTDHKYDMKNQKHTNYKVQNAYNSYGIPALFILERCLIAELNTKEIQWMYEFDALGNQGLCIIEGGRVGFGTNANNSKYSRREVLKIFSLLYKTKLPQRKISNRLNVSYDLVKDIVKQKNHTWLKEAYPQQYEKMLENNKYRKLNSTTLADKIGFIPKIIVSPRGQKYTVTCITQLCKSHPDLNICLKNSKTGISRVLSSTRKQYKGWKLSV